jgi:hypothetical protein
VEGGDAGVLHKHVHTDISFQHHPVSGVDVTMHGYLHFSLEFVVFGTRDWASDRPYISRAVDGVLSRLLEGDGASNHASLHTTEGECVLVGVDAWRTAFVLRIAGSASCDASREKAYPPPPNPERRVSARLTEKVQG